MIKMTRSISTQKSDPKAALYHGEKDLLILLGLALLRIRSVLLLYSFIELGGYENHSVVLDSLGRCYEYSAGESSQPVRRDDSPSSGLK